MPRVKLFSEYGCTVLRRGEKYYIQYDSGEAAGSSLMENEITFSEVERARKSEQEAYEVIMDATKRSIPIKVDV